MPVTRVCRRLRGRPHAAAVWVTLLLLAGPACGRDEHPRLFFKGERLEELKRLAHSEDGKVIMARLKELLEHDKKGFGYNPNDSAFPYCEGYWAAGHALVYLLEGGEYHKESSRKWIEEGMKLRAKEWGGWGNAQMIAGTAYTYDMMEKHWDAEFTRSVRAFLLKQGKFVEHKGDPDANRRGLFGAARGLACLAALNGGGDDAAAKEELEKIKDDLVAFSRIAVGERGWRGGAWCGFADAADIILPFIRAYRNGFGERAFPETGFDHVGAVAVMNGGIFHRDMGDSAWGTTTLLVAPEEVRPAIKWCMEQCTADPEAGQYRDPPRHNHHIRWPSHALFALCYAAGLEAKHPSEVLGNSYRDASMGGFVFRGGWKPGDLMVLFDAQTRGVSAPLTATTFGLGRAEARPYKLRMLVDPLRPTGIGEWHSNTNRYASRTDGAPAVVRILHGAHDVIPLGRPRIVHEKTAEDGRTAVITVVTDHFVHGRVRPGYFDQANPHRIESDRNVGVTHTRSFAVDLTGECGAKCLVVIADKLDGAEKFTTFAQINAGKGKVPLSFKLPSGKEPWPHPGTDAIRKLEDTPAYWPTSQAEAPRREGCPLLALPGRAVIFALEKKEKAGTLCVTGVAPGAWALIQDGHQLSRIGGGILVAPGDGKGFLTILTVQDGEPPAMDIKGQGLDAEIRMGRRTVRFDGQNVILD